MGFTALDGLPMGTRPGQLDPGVVLHLIEERGMTAPEVTRLLYNASGLKGLSGVSNDMRDLLASPDPAAAFAIDHFIHRAALSAGQLAAALGGLDAFVFTAGIGEHSPPSAPASPHASLGSVPPSTRPPTTPAPPASPPRRATSPFSSSPPTRS